MFLPVVCLTPSFNALFNVSVKLELVQMAGKVHL